MTEPEQFIADRIATLPYVRDPQDVNIYEIAKSLGIHVIMRPMRSELTGTETFPIVILDSRLSEPEKRVDLAHEICHYVAHAGNQLFLSDSLTELQENQARIMVQYLLCPTQLLERVLDGQVFHSEHEIPIFIASDFNVPIPFAKQRLSTFWRDRRIRTTPRLGLDYDTVWEHPCSGRRMYFKNGNLVSRLEGKHDD